MFDLNIFDFQITDQSNNVLLYDTSDNIPLPQCWVHISTSFALKSNQVCDISFNLYSDISLAQSHKVRCDVSNVNTLYNIDYGFTLAGPSSNLYSIYAATDPSNALLYYSGNYYNKFILNHYPYP